MFTEHLLFICQVIHQDTNVPVGLKDSSPPQRAYNTFEEIRVIYL